MRTGVAFLGLMVSLLACTSRAVASSPEDVHVTFFEKRIRPVLVEHCYRCHSVAAQKPKGGLLLDSRANLRKGGDSGPVVVPGKPDASLLIKAVRYQGDNVHMPPKGKLPDLIIADLEKWVALGAPQPRDSAGPVVAAKTAIDVEAARKFWAFQPPHAHPVPSVQDRAWPSADMDRFILARLEQQGFRPAKDADRYTLLRRVTLDLTGLPPTPADSLAFVNDAAPNAFEKVVDRLLASAAFGERWGRHWLDLAQFADTVSTDRLFPDKGAWRYRDYVIRSFNDDKCFNQFLTEQIAGDLLPYQTDRQRADQMIATAFLTQGPIQLINQLKEQLRMDLVDNQIDKVGQVFLGLTLGCARCHDHKFDPIRQSEYYALAGIFQNVQLLNGTLGKSKVFSKWVQRPIPESAEEAQEQRLLRAEHARVTAELERQLQDAQAKQADLQRRLRELKANPAGTQAPTGDLQPTLAKVQQTNRELQTKLTNHVKANAPEPAAVFAAQEVPEPINCRINIRGNAYQLGEEVPRGFPAIATGGQPATIPQGQSGRRQLAAWLTNASNPLTARVAVNRIWHHLFGAGLVRTVDNFGIRGERPSHPELLDSLAIQFVEQGWSVKRLIRQLVLSRAYRMASEHNPAAWEIDPDNRLLWRMNRRRLEAEAIRDTVLWVSGQLDRRAGGPTLPPARFNAGTLTDFIQLNGEATPAPEVLRRRSVYLPVFRRTTEWFDALMLFDFAEPTVVTGARTITTVPTQSLYLMNAPFLSEQGRFTAQRLLVEPHGDDRARVDWLYRCALSRPATAAEVDRALDFMQQLTTAPTPVRTTGGDARLEGWAVFCHAVFASNEFLFRW